MQLLYVVVGHSFLCIGQFHLSMLRGDERSLFVTKLATSSVCFILFTPGLYFQAQYGLIVGNMR